MNPIKKVSIIEASEYNAAVLYHKENEIYESFTAIELKGNQTYSIYNEIINNQLVIVNALGLIQIYDITTNALLFQHDLKADNTDTFAECSLTDNLLCVTYVANYDPKFIIINLGDFSILKDIVLAPPYPKQQFTISNGNIQFYYINENEETGSFEHGIEAYNYKKETFTQYKLPNSPKSIYNSFNFIRIPNKELALVPCWKAIDITTKIDEDSSFPLFCQIVDLKTYTIIKQIELATIKVKEMEDPEEFLETVSDASDDIFSYNNMLAEFYNQLQNPFIDIDGSIWFKITDSYYIQLDENGEYLSAIAIKDLSRRALRNLAFLPKNRELEMEIKEEHGILLDSFGQINIHLKDVTSNNELCLAVTKMEEFIDNIDSIRSANRIFFSFTDENGNTINEKEFFQKVVSLPKQAEKINSLYLKLMENKDFEFLFYDFETKAFGHALHALVMHDEKYLKTLALYYKNIDMEHDNFTNGHILPDALEKYPNSKLLEQIETAVGEFYG